MDENKLNSKEQKVISLLKQAFELIKDDKELSLFIFMVKKEEETNMIQTIENWGGREQDIFSGMLAAHDDEIPSLTKNLLINFFNYQITQQMENSKKAIGNLSNMNIVKPKGDA